MFYETEKDLCQIAASFFRTGVENNELCVWVVPPYMGIEGAKKSLGAEIEDLDAHIRKGRMKFMNSTDVYNGPDGISPDKLLDGLTRMERDALEKGFSALRISGDASWLPEVNWEKFVDYERRVNELLKEKKITALCTFPMQKLDLHNIFTMKLYHGVTITNQSGHIEYSKNY